MQFLKEKRNEIIKLGIFVITTVLVGLFTNLKFKDVVLWPYEKKARLILILFAFLFYIYSLYFTMKTTTKWYKILYRFLPSLVLIFIFLNCSKKIIVYIPYLLPVVMVVLTYKIINALLFQVFTVLLYYFTGVLSEELIMFYLVFGLAVIFIAKYAKTR